MTALTPHQHRALGRIEGLAEESGLPIETLIDQLRAWDDPAEAADGKTVALLIERATAALDPGTVRAYGSYWRVLRDGIWLPAAWDDDRIHQAPHARARRDSLPWLWARGLMTAGAHSGGWPRRTVSVSGVPDTPAVRRPWRNATVSTGTTPRSPRRSRPS